MSDLSNRKCIPCQGGLPPLSHEQIEPLINELGGNWKVVDDHHLMKEYVFPDFITALEFVNKLGAIAEEEGHHPDVYLSWGKVVVLIWTHKIDGLTESDFILAAKLDQIKRAD